MEALRPIANVVKLSGCDVPEWMLKLKRPRRDELARREVRAPRRHHIATASAFDLKKQRRRKQMIDVGQERTRVGTRVERPTRATV